MDKTRVRCSKMSQINADLNKLGYYKDLACQVCGETKTILNIEGHIHHKRKLVCLNRKQCERRKKKRR